MSTPTPAGAIPVGETAELPDPVTWQPSFRCPECRCRDFARIAEKKPDGSFGSGPMIRCVECKRTYRSPDPFAALTPAAGPVTVPEEVRLLSEAATQGEWKAARTDPAEGYDCYWIVGNTEGHNRETELGSMVGGIPHELRRANAELVCAAVNYVRTLLANPPPSGRARPISATHQIDAITRRRFDQMSEAWNAGGKLDEGDLSFLFRMAGLYLYPPSGRADTPPGGGGTVPAGWRLVPGTATREWAYAMAVARHGRSSEPRCEPTSERDIPWAADRIDEALAAAPAAPEPTAGGGQDLSDPWAVFRGMADGKIAKPKLYHLVRLYGIDTLREELSRKSDPLDIPAVARSRAVWGRSTGNDSDGTCLLLEEIARRIDSEARSILSAPTEAGGAGGDSASLDDRLRAAGMFTISEMMGETPMTRWEIHAGMTDLAAFDAWLDRKVAEYLRMASAYTLGDKDKDDELYEWVVAHSAAFRAIRTNFKAATRRPDPTPAGTGAEGGQHADC